MYHSHGSGWHLILSFSQRDTVTGWRAQSRRIFTSDVNTCNLRVTVKNGAQLSQWLWLDAAGR